MKRSITLIICFFSIFSTTNAFFGEPSSIDLYKNIDEGLYEIEDKIIGFELNGGERKTGILKEINRLAKYNELPECLDESKNISVAEFKEITTKENINKLTAYFSNSCYDSEEKKYSLDMTTSYMVLFKEYLNENTFIAEEKTKKIYQVSNIGLYSDGILENSGFDLISDIEDIDKIIFSKVSEYEGEKNENLDGFIDMMADYEDNKDGDNNIPLLPREDTLADIIPYYNSDISESDKIEIKNTVSNYICQDNSANSGLNNGSIIPLLYNIDSTQNNTNEGWEQDSDKPFGLDYIGQNSIGFEVDMPESDYAKIIDNSEFPCDDFFCIAIEFITHDNDMFSSSNMTIEYLIKRSNEHLSKFVSTSLIPAKMSTNQFELGLQGLDLPSIFHLGILISKKPIPILNIEEEGKKDQTEYASKNLLEKYYKANGLDYKRRNSLVLLNDIEQDKQNVNNSVGLPISKIVYNNRDYGKQKTENNNSSTINKIIGKKVSYGITKNFEEQFTELDKFITAINDYIENLYSIISEMEKIPIESA